jgi:hypothetical protein
MKRRQQLSLWVNNRKGNTRRTKKLTLERQEEGPLRGGSATPKDTWSSLRSSRSQRSERSMLTRLVSFQGQQSTLKLRPLRTRTSGYQLAIGFPFSNSPHTRSITYLFNGVESQFQNGVCASLNEAAKHMRILSSNGRVLLKAYEEWGGFASVWACPLFLQNTNVGPSIND